MIIDSQISCCGPLIPPKPVSNGYLLMLFLITRHGARSPSKNWAREEYLGKWECGNRFNTGFWRTPYVNGEKTEIYKNNPNNIEFLLEEEKSLESLFFCDFSQKEYKISFPPSCPKGNLLDLGVDQLVNLGNLYRNYLIKQTHLLPSKYDPRTIYIRSSFVPRCIESAVAIINGLYPPDNDSEILNIKTGLSQKEPLCPYSESANEFDELSKEFVKKDEYKKRIEFFNNLTNLHKFLNMKVVNEIDNLAVADFLNCFRCSGNELPFPPFNQEKFNRIFDSGIEKVDSEKILSDDDYDKLMSNLAFYDAGFLNFSGNISYLPILKMISNQIDRLFEMEETVEKFILFSGHDATISAVLVALGHLDLTSPPPFASHLSVELWQIEKPCLRFVYNGEVIKFRGNELTPLDEFRSFFFPK